MLAWILEGNIGIALEEIDFEARGRIEFCPTLPLTLPVLKLPVRYFLLFVLNIFQVTSYLEQVTLQMKCPCVFNEISSIASVVSILC
jgi:hypothetical protein